MEISRSSSRFLPLVCASLAILLGLLTLAGWTTGFSILASVRAKYIPMAPSTALCFSLIGVGLIQQLTIPVLRRGAWLLSVIVLVVACAKLAEFLGGINFGIDAWFVRNPGRFGAVPTGRMSPITAANFIFTAAGLFVLAHPCLQKWAGVFGAVATAVAAIVLTGYCYGTPLLYGGMVIPVAFSTACAFLLCGAAIVIAAGAEQWPLRMFHGDSTRALLLRTFVPLIVAASLINGYINTTRAGRRAVCCGFCRVDWLDHFRVIDGDWRPDRSR